jgi:hypothetical protein
MLIPYGMDYYATVSGSILKRVQCEQCEHEYGYLMTRKGRGLARSWMFLDKQGASESANRKAEKQLFRRLEQSCDPVPCPRCGWYQEEMVRRLRRNHFRWLFFIGLALAGAAFLGGLIMYFCTVEIHLNARPGDLQIPARDIYVGWSVVALLLLLSPTLIIVRSVMARRLDPNGEPVEKRRQQGQTMAMPEKEFREILLAEEEEAENPPT